MPRLENYVLVNFDVLGVPYIEAKSEADAYQAQGYLVARERMFQMDLLRRAANGELSEIFGPSALPADRLMRTVGIRRIAEDEVGHLTPLAKAALDQYCLGVNRYLSANADQLSVEFALLGYSPKAWKPADSLAVMKYLAYELDESWKLDDLRQRVKERVDKDAYADLFRDDFVTPLSNQSNQASQSNQPSSAASLSGSGNSPPSTEPPASVPGTKPAPARPAAAIKNPGVNRRPRPTPAPALRTSPVGFNRSVESLPVSRESTPALGQRLGDQLSKLAAVQTLLPKHWISGSTAIAIAPARSSTGGALLVCEKHERLTIPPLWYALSINAPGLRIAGATIPAVPGVMIGRSDKIGWASASLKADVQDLFVEQFDSQFGQKVRGPKGWQDVTDRTEVIPVRWSPDTEHRITTTERGPILFRNGDTGVALSWTGSDATKPAFNACYALNHAQDWNTFKQALLTYADPPAAFMYADRSGNIGCQAAGSIPVRQGSADGTTLMSAWSNNGAWTGTISPQRLPLVTIPAGQKVTSGSGVLVAANQKLVPNAIGAPAAPANTFFGKQFNPPYRANRLLRMLEIQTPPTPSISLSGVSAILADQYASSAGVVRQQLVAALTHRPTSDLTLRPAIQAMDHWDGQLKTTSMPASFYETFFMQIARRSLEPKLGNDMTNQYLERWPMWSTFTEHCVRDLPPRWLPPQFRSYDTFLLASFMQSAKELRISFLNKPLKDWGWGGIHQIDFAAPLDFRSPVFTLFSTIGGVQAGGDENSIMTCDISAADPNKPFRVQSGPVNRLLIDMQDDEKMYQLTLPGESGHFLSPFRDNQLPAWLHNDVLPMALSKEQLARQTKSKLILNNTATE